MEYRVCLRCGKNDLTAPNSCWFHPFTTAFPGPFIGKWQIPALQTYIAAECNFVMLFGSILLICLGTPEWIYCRNNCSATSAPCHCHTQHYYASAVQKKLVISSPVLNKPVTTAFTNLFGPPTHISPRLQNVEQPSKKKKKREVIVPFTRQLDEYLANNT